MWISFHSAARYADIMRSFTGLWRYCSAHLVWAVRFVLAEQAHARVAIVVNLVGELDCVADMAIEGVSRVRAWRWWWQVRCD